MLNKIPCLHRGKCIENSIENVHTDVKVLSMLRVNQ